MNSKKDLIDEIDRQIINILLQDANTSFVDIAKEIQVSPGTIHVRMKRLQKLNIIHKAFLNINYAMLGYDMKAYLGIHLEKGKSYTDVVQFLYKIPEVIQCSYVTGPYSMFVRIICRDTDHLREVILEKINCIEGIAKTETFVSLEESIHRSKLID